MVMNVVYCFKKKTHFESTLKKQKFKNHWILNISLTYGYMQSICVIYVKNVCHLSKDSCDPTFFSFLVEGGAEGICTCTEEHKI